MENFETTSPTTRPIKMEPFLQRVPPIKGVFSPDEEVQKLWSVPKEKRREAVSVFKGKLTRQRKAWALCRTTIEERIEANPDIPKEEMVEIIGQFASNYGFAKTHTRLAEKLIDDYIFARKRVMRVIEKYPDNIALINRLTGTKFTNAEAGDFNISVGPMSIDISCSGFNAKRISERSKGPVVDFRFLGFASESNDKPPIYYTVINTDEVDFYYPHHPLEHEHEHEKNKLLESRLYPRLNRGAIGFFRHQVLEKALRFERNLEDELWKRYLSSKDIQQKSFFLGEYFRMQREVALDGAKDEIVSCLKNRGLSRLRNELGELFFSNEGPYDYLASLRNWEKGKDDPLWKETSQKFLVDEYRAIIETAIDYFGQLIYSGYTKEEAIALLFDKPLSNWPKTVRRLLSK